MNGKPLYSASSSNSGLAERKTEAQSAPLIDSLRETTANGAQPQPGTSTGMHRATDGAAQSRAAFEASRSRPAHDTAQPASGSTNSARQPANSMSRSRPPPAASRANIPNDIPRSAPQIRNMPASNAYRPVPAQGAPPSASSPAPASAASQPTAVVPPSDSSASQPMPGAIRDSLAANDIVLPMYTSGQHRSLCPHCTGGSTRERSLSIDISPSSRQAKWLCHRAKCGWKGQLDLDAPNAKGTGVSQRCLACPTARPTRLSM